MLPNLPPDVSDMVGSVGKGSSDQKSAAYWINIARHAYDIATSYIDINCRKTWENNIRHFQSRHHRDSKYNSANYMYRSKFFRPKTRAAERQLEAAAVAAFFSNPDVTSILAENPSDPNQAAAAEIMHQILEYRLDNRMSNGIPWFQILMGAIQSAWVLGAVISKQYWQFEEVDELDYEPLIVDGQLVYDESGRPTLVEVTKRRKVLDRPWIELKPIENMRLHPASDWVDPINSSPFIIDIQPVFVIDLKKKFDERDPLTGKPRWNPLTDEQILSASRNSMDTTRLEREYGRQSKYEQTMPSELRNYDVVWVHEHIHKIDGRDITFKTLGNDFLLTDPRPLEMVYHHKIRPYVFGTCVIEAHRLYPPGIGELGEEIQKELNEIANQRMDNVKLALNKRFLVKRGSQVDVRSLTRNVPGGVTFVGSLGGQKGPDLFPLEFNDVTSSSFQEQDRLNADYDEIVGSFSVSSIHTNRKLGETVGGMAMLRGGVNQIMEAELRIFAETWVEPVLRQLIRLEQTYENDETVVAIAMTRANLFPRYGIDYAINELLQKDLTLKVNVGMGATDPIMKIQNMHMGARIVAETASVPGVFNVAEIAKEVFGRLGYKDGLRFLSGGAETDPEKAQLIQMVQQLQAALQDKMSDRELKVLLTQIKESGHDRRKAADLDTRLLEKHMELMNPVAGEKALPV